MTRSRVPKGLGLVVGLVGLLALTVACAAPAPPAAPATAAKPVAAAPPPPAPAPAPAAPAKQPAAPAPAKAAAPAAAVATVNIVAKDYTFEIDKLVVPAGKVHFTFKNQGKQTHDFWIYQAQDLSPYLNKKRAGEKVKGRDFLKGATELFDLEAGKSGEADFDLKPGYYEVSCFVMGKNPDGTSYVHVDKGQTLWLTVTGPGFPPAATTAANTISVEMKSGEGNSWLFVPDKLVVPAGDVTFKVANREKEEHDFVVHEIGDVSAFTAAYLQGKKPHDVTHDLLKARKGAELMEDLAAGKSAEKTVKLTPGLWVAACYMVGKNPDGTSFIHSDRGQRFVFTVK